MEISSLKPAETSLFTPSESVPLFRNLMRTAVNIFCAEFDTRGLVTILSNGISADDNEHSYNECLKMDEDVKKEIDRVMEVQLVFGSLKTIHALLKSPQFGKEIFRQYRSCKSRKSRRKPQTGEHEKSHLKQDAEDELLDGDLLRKLLSVVLDIARRPCPINKAITVGDLERALSVLLCQVSKDSSKAKGR